MSQWSQKLYLHAAKAPVLVALPTCLLHEPLNPVEGWVECIPGPHSIFSNHNYPVSQKAQEGVGQWPSPVQAVA